MAPIVLTPKEDLFPLESDTLLQAGAESKTARFRTYGVVLALLSVLVTSPDPALARGNADNCSTSVFVAWKNLITAMTAGAVGVWQMHQAERPTAALRWSRGAWGHLGLGALCFSLNWMNTLGVLFSIPSLAIMVFYTFPLWALVMSTVFFGETLRWITVATICVAVLCVAVPTLLSIQADHDTPIFTWVALLFSLIAGVGYAGFLTVCRSAQAEFPDLPMNLATGVGNAVGSIVGFTWAIIEGADMTPANTNFWILVLLDGFVIGAGAAFLPFASKYLENAELSAILMLDLVLVQGPLYLFHFETVKVEKIVGSVVLLLALITHECVVSHDTPDPLLLQMSNSEVLEAGETRRFTGPVCADDALRPVVPHKPQPKFKSWPVFSSASAKCDSQF